MRSNDGTRTGGEILVDQLAIHGVRHAFCVPGESYLAALDAFYDCDDRAHRLPARERRRYHGRSGRQDDRPPRHLFRHARAGRHQRLGRHPHRAPGFHADDRVRRPGRPRDARARSVPGTRLPRGVRLDRQMGDRDRRSRADPGTGVARLSYRLQRPARAGGGRDAGGHADRARIGAGRQSLRAGGNLARSDRHEPAAKTALGRQAPGRADRRQPLVGASLRRPGALCRALRAAGRHHLPPPVICSTRCILVTPATSASGPIRNCWRA